MRSPTIKKLDSTENAECLCALRPIKALSAQLRREVPKILAHKSTAPETKKSPEPKAKAHALKTRSQRASTATAALPLRAASPRAPLSKRNREILER